MCLWFWVGGKPSAVAVNRLLSALTLLGGVSSMFVLELCVDVLYPVPAYKLSGDCH
jgi:hypothetical protein